MRAARANQRSWHRIGRWGLLVALVLLVGGNIIAWQQAWTMTHYVTGETRTPAIERLSGLEKVWTVLAGVRVPRPENTHTPADVGLAYQTAIIPADSGETLEAWVVEATPSRGVILLFPGYATPKESLLGAATAFHGWGYTAVLVDFRGVGGSSRSDTTLGVREGADVALAAHWAAVRWRGRPWVLYGFSMGSAAVLEAVAHHGVQPAALILESPFDRLLDATRTRFHAMGLPGTPGAELLLFWGSVQGGSNAFALAPADDAASVQHPTLVLHGGADPRVSQAQAQAVYERLSGPRTWSEIPGAGHDVLGTAPDAWQAAVRAFLTTIGEQDQ
jgi:alpha-beta hydrolase superfamily lysophospholipase